jgi:hypothetical protein
MTVALTGSPVVIAPAPSTHHGVLKALSGHFNHWIRALRTLIREAPMTTAYLAIILITTASLASSNPHAVHSMVASASTNLHNMAIDPLRVLVVSAFWVQSAPWIWLLAPLLVVIMVPAERLLGIGRTLLIFAAGHLGATALTVAAIGVGVDHGLLPHRLTYALDVGPSYGLVAIAAVLATRLPRGRVRGVAIGALLLGLTTVVVIGGDFTDAGHLIAALIGLACSRFVTGTARASHGSRASLRRIDVEPSAYSATKLGAIREALVTIWLWPVAGDNPDDQSSTKQALRRAGASVAVVCGPASHRVSAGNHCPTVADHGTAQAGLHLKSRLRPRPSRDRLCARSPARRR